MFFVSNLASSSQAGSQKLHSDERRMAGDGRFDFLMSHTLRTQVLAQENVTTTKTVAPP
jgi:hypothetical protein